ncbi:MAG TPA: glycosyltransferase family 1 protein [Phycisphaerales bacterium]|nr:glycosyltransferase family 1 protein [Phycisphaerales bacterium]
MGSPLKILHISTRLILGGSQENTVLSCEGQARLGHEVHLAFGPIFGPEGSMLDRVQGFRTDDGRGITTHELPNMVREVNPWKDHFCFHHDLKRLIREIRPDVVHTHSSKAGILGRWAAWTFGAAGGPRPAVVHTIHGPPFMPIEGGMLGRNTIRMKNKVYEIAERFAAKRCHTIVAVADAMTSQFLARGIGRPEQYVTVRSGMEIEPYLHPPTGTLREDIRRELGLGDDDFVIGTVARLAQHKGHDDLLDALKDDLRANANWKLLWVGDGWWRDRLLAKAEAFGVRGQLITTGLVPPARVPAMIRAMDVLAHPSYREGLPRTVPQALLCGVCPVAYDVDGTREACRDEQTGLLVKPGDIEGLRAAIRRLHNDPDWRTKLAQHGQAWCTTEFSAATMVERLERVYRDAIERAGRGGDALGSRTGTTQPGRA